MLVGSCCRKVARWLSTWSSHYRSGFILVVPGHFVCIVALGMLTFILVVPGQFVYDKGTFVFRLLGQCQTQLCIVDCRIEKK